MFTQLNQYHVILEVKPNFHDNARRSARALRPNRRGVRRQIRRCGRRHRHGGFERAHQFRHRIQASLNSTGSSNANGAAPIPSTAAFPNGGQVPLGGLQHHRDSHRSHRDQSPGPVSGGDALVQSGSQRVARRGCGGGEQGQRRSGLAAPAFKPPIKVPPRRSRHRSPTSRY